MNLQLGSQVFNNVEIPILWGTRAILQDAKRRMSVIDLGGSHAKIEILGDKPAPGVEFKPLSDDLVEILENGKSLYIFDSNRKCLQSITLDLPECEIRPNGTRIGGSFFQGNTITGAPVGIVVSATGIGIGASLPPGLAKLRI